MAASCNDIFFASPDDNVAEDVYVCMRFITRTLMFELQEYHPGIIQICESSRLVR
jgi:hypothetical protein